MKVNYRGFDVDAHREKCLAGYDLLYYSVFRKSDGCELTSGYTEGSDTVREYIGYMKDRVDEFIKNPADDMSIEPNDEHYEQELAEHIAENEKTERQHGLPLSKRARAALPPFPPPLKASAPDPVFKHRTPVIPDSLKKSNGFMAGFGLGWAVWEFEKQP